MRLKNSMLAFALAVVAGFGLTRCGDNTPESGLCSVDSDCTAAGEICHQTAKVCVKTCNAGADCPSTAKTCDTAPWLKGSSGADGGSAVKICQCSTDQLCGGGDTICSNADKICVTKCTSSSDCAGRTCDTATGQCGGGGATGTACSTTNPQPDVCTYGSACGTDAKCAAVAAPTCANFPAASAPKMWSASTSTGPVIYAVTEESVDDAAFCQTNAFAHTYLVRAYRTDANWPAAFMDAPALYYYLDDGVQRSVTGSIRPMSGYTPNGKVATFKITLCGANAPRTDGFAFTGGNGFCGNSSQGTQGTM